MNNDSNVQPVVGKAAAARGPWILDSGASEFMVGKTNITKREVREADTTGPEVLFSTANGVVHRRRRTPQHLPHGPDMLVGALSMEDMDMNIASI